MIKTGFTIIELIFVIVIIAILAAVALPKFSNNIKEANILKIKNEVHIVKTGIQNSLNNNFLQDVNKCPELEKSLDNDTVFEKILAKPIYKNDNNIIWETTDGKKYTVSFKDFHANFEYNNSIDSKCSFTCIDDSEFCKTINKE